MGIYKSKYHEQRYMEICILFLPFLDYVDDESVSKGFTQIIG
jgi:hypothetical protein